MLRIALAVAAFLLSLPALAQQPPTLRNYECRVGDTSVGSNIGPLRQLADTHRMLGDAIRNLLPRAANNPSLQQTLEKLLLALDAEAVASRQLLESLEDAQHQFRLCAR